MKPDCPKLDRPVLISGHTFGLALMRPRMGTGEAGRERDGGD